MTDTRWTPGPWLIMDYNADEDFPRWCIVPHSCIGTIAHVQGDGANASLIAAAPDLYEALSGLHSAMDSAVEMTPELMLKARAALKKARGETND